MCHYCCYLAHVNGSSSSTSDLNKQSISRPSKHQRTQSYHLTMPICLVSLTLFFILLNITLVLSQSSQFQQQQQTPHHILEQKNSRGKKTILTYVQLRRNSFLFSRKNNTHSMVLFFLYPTSLFLDVSGVHTFLGEDQQRAKYRRYAPTPPAHPANPNTTLYQPKTKRLTHEKRLIRNLLENYPTIYARPIRNVSDPLIVSFGLTLTQLFDLGSTGQKMQTNTWKTLMWQDMNLVWNPLDYGGLANVCLPADSIWTPVRNSTATNDLSIAASFSGCCSV